MAKEQAGENRLMDKPVRLYTRDFFMLCLSSFLFFMSFNLLLPELNRYITGLGGSDLKQYNIALFAFAALISRPLSGRLSDVIGRIPIMIFGAMVCFVMGFMYPLLEGLTAYLVLRFLHGFSAGFKPTATTAYMADIVPSGRRGEAVGLLGMAGSMGMAVGPPVGSFISMEIGTDLMFYSSSIAAILSIAVIAGMRETLVGKQRFTARSLIITPADLFDKKVTEPAIVMFLSVASFGMTSFMIPDLSDHLGITNRGTFFSIYIAVSIALRMFMGKLSDRVGRILMLRVGMVFLILGMIGIAFATKPWILYAAAILFGTANGINGPTIFAWTIDLADDRFRARATSSLFIALEGGIIAGTLIAGAIYHNNPENFSLAFLVGACMAAVALLFLLFRTKIN